MAVTIPVYQKAGRTNHCIYMLKLNLDLDLGRKGAARITELHLCHHKSAHMTAGVHCHSISLLNEMCRKQHRLSCCLPLAGPATVAGHEKW